MNELEPKSADLQEDADRALQAVLASNTEIRGILSRVVEDIPVTTEASVPENPPEVAVSKATPEPLPSPKPVATKTKRIYSGGLTRKITAAEIFEKALLTQAVPCQDVYPEAFFVTDAPSNKDARNKAMAACGKCALKWECLATAYERDEEGIWGGTTTEERQRLKNQKQRNGVAKQSTEK